MNPHRGIAADKEGNTLLFHSPTRHIIASDNMSRKRIFIVGDVHWCQNSSIVRGMGAKYSVRLENLIKSVDWAESKAVEEGADLIVYLGDFFDKPELNSMEITALKDVRWSFAEHVFLVGNHEASNASLEFNSANVLRGLGFKVIDEPVQSNGVLYLPYVSEDRRKPLAEYLSGNAGLVLSHNDVKGIRYGGFLSRNGFPIEDIKALHGEGRVGMFVNGHLHNHAEFEDESGSVFLMNLGNLTGQNFSEDADLYGHSAMVYEMEFGEGWEEMGVDSFTLHRNPEAMNFYKLHSGRLNGLAVPRNSVVSITARRGDAPAVEGFLKANADKVLASRVTWEMEPASPEEAKGFEKSDHLVMFREFALSELGRAPKVEEELAEVLG